MTHIEKMSTIWVFPKRNENHYSKGEKGAIWSELFLIFDNPQEILNACNTNGVPQ